MTYEPGLGTPIPMVHATGPWGKIDSSFTASGYASAAFPSANTAYYFPVLVPCTTVVRRVWWANGSTVSASYNIDCGVYTDAGHKPGARLVSSGSTAQGTASQVQFVDVTDTALAPGWYWIALTCSSASATIMRIAGSSSLHALYKMQESSALPLPATATPVLSTSNNIQLFGFATTASP